MKQRAFHQVPSVHMWPTLYEYKFLQEVNFASFTIQHIIRKSKNCKNSHVHRIMQLGEAVSTKLDEHKPPHLEKCVYI